MKLKTYKVANLAEAIVKIKKDLGDNALVISTKKMSRRDMWWKLKPMIEVTAVCDVTDESEIQRYLGRKMSPAKALGKLVQKSVEPVMSELGKFKDNLFSAGSVPKANPFKKISKPSENPVKKEAAPKDIEPDQSVMKIVRNLLWHGVSQEHAVLYADIMAKNGAGTHDDNILKEKLAEYLLQSLPAPMNISQVHLNNKIHIVCGEAGSGKSSVILKLATMEYLENNHKVAFITFDKDKSGVDSDIRKHAMVLKAPCALARNERELIQQAERFNSYDIIFIETNIKQINSLDPSFIGNSHVSLVLPILGKLSAQAAAHRIDSLIVSRMDETDRFGNLINHALDYGKPYLAFSTGAQIPEDMEEASLERIVDCLLNFSGRHPALSDESAYSNGASSFEAYQ